MDSSSDESANSTSEKRLFTHTDIIDLLIVALCLAKGLSRSFLGGIFENIKITLK